MGWCSGLAGEHLLDGLPGHSELAGDLGLGEAVVDQPSEEVATFAGQPAGPPGMPLRLGAHLHQPPPIVPTHQSINGLHHPTSLTTRGCQGNAVGVAFWP